MEKFYDYLEKYAVLALKIGVNLQQDQLLVVTAPVTSRDFVHLLTRQAYEMGAKKVHINWTDNALSRIEYEKAPEEALTAYPEWQASGYETLAESDAAFLSIDASDPALLDGISSDKISAKNKAARKALKSYSMMQRASRISWCKITVPTVNWATKVFPESSQETAVDKLWQTIFEAIRLNQDDPVQAWNAHIHRLREKVSLLNSKSIRTLFYKAPGTDLSIELVDHPVWAGGGETNRQGTFFVPNLPTEEVFCMPKKHGVNGYIRSTKPLNYDGRLIDDFTLHFKNGRIVSCTATEGRGELEALVATDEGSHYLGEVALVPDNSPISQTGFLFYNTLFDENASCHLAIGAPYPFNTKGGSDLSEEALEARGANNSLIHVDFMIGSANMQIDAVTEDGERFPLFRDGVWAE